MSTIQVGTPSGFPKKQMIDWRHSAAAAAEAFPAHDIYEFARRVGGSIIMIDPDPRPIETASDRQDRDAAPAEVLPQSNPSALQPTGLGAVISALTFSPGK